MGAITPSELHRGEVEQVLHSGLFAKAPRLERFFRYICECELEGRGDQVKEYSIAVEALDRPPDFDPKKDSIVRVEAHRLRKRLDLYYAGKSVDHRVRICIPNGQYRPRFVCEDVPAPAEHAGEPQISPVFSPALSQLDLAGGSAIEGPHQAGASKGRWLWPTVLLLACCSLIAVASFLMRPNLKAPHPVNKLVETKQGAEVWAPPKSGVAVPAEVRLLTGYHGPPLSDRQGHTWLADAYYRGGASIPVEPWHLIEGLPDLLLVKAQRSGEFQYDIPLRHCSYEMHLYLAETDYGRGNSAGGAEGTRLFNVAVNGKTVLQTFDPLAEAGAPNRLCERVFKDVHPAPDGKLHLAFQPLTAPAFLNAIQVVPSAAGRIHPVRIVAQEQSVTDSDGRLWAADEYFSGGNAVVRTSVVTNSTEALYQGERYGNFSYRIPLAAGKYRLTLHFAETWFGAESPEPALDSRIFNVFANGVALLRNYQIVNDAGGPNRGIEKVFNHLEPNAQGILRLDFVPVKNYAEVNAIEVVETE